MTRTAVRQGADVLASAAAGDEIAFRRLITMHHEDMRRVCAYVAPVDRLGIVVRDAGVVVGGQRGVTIKLNHTIVYVADKHASAAFLADLFGLPEPVAWGSFLTVELANEVTLDFFDARGAGSPQHYAFLVTEDEFDRIFGRIRERGLDFWADPGHRQPGEVNTHDAGRGVYFDDPSGHMLEIITQPYGNER